MTMENIGIRSPEHEIFLENGRVMENMNKIDVLSKEDIIKFVEFGFRISHP